MARSIDIELDNIYQLWITVYMLNLFLDYLLWWIFDEDDEKKVTQYSKDIKCKVVGCV